MDLQQQNLFDRDFLDPKEHHFEFLAHQTAAVVNLVCYVQMHSEDHFLHIHHVHQLDERKALFYNSEDDIFFQHHQQLDVRVNN